MKLKFKILILSLVAVFALGAALPAKAFYLDVPDIFVKAVEVFQINRSQAQMGSEMQPAPMMNQPMMNQPMMNQPMMNQPMMNQPMMNQPMMNQDQMNSGQYGPNQPGMGMDSFGNNNMNNQPNNMGPGQGMGNQGPGMMDSGMGFKGIKSGAKQMLRNLNKLQGEFLKAEKSGVSMDSALKEKADQAKAALECAQNATDDTSMQSCNVESVGDMMNELEQSRQQVVEGANRVKDIKNQIRGPEQGLKMFKSQLKKAGNCVTAELKEKLTGLETAIVAIKAAKTWEEIEAAGLENLGDTMNSLDESRQSLEMCSRWPQTEKEMNRQLKQLQTALKRSKTMATRLAKKGIDVSGVLSEFESAVTKLQATRDEAKAKLAEDPQSAFDLIEDEFFGQTEDVWQNQKLIEMMSNFGQFTSEFKKGVADGQRQINKLAKKGEDVTELKDLFEQIKVNGAEIMAAMKDKEADPESIMSSIQDLEDLGQQFDSALEELGVSVSGGPVKPWEQGPQQFKSMQLPSGLNQYMNQGGGGGPGRMPMQGNAYTPGTNPVGESNPSPAP